MGVQLQALLELGGNVVVISTAVQHEDRVDIYNERNILVGSHLGQLHGYTSSTVSIRRGSMIDTYDDNGVQIFAIRESSISKRKE